MSRNRRSVAVLGAVVVVVVGAVALWWLTRPATGLDALADDPDLVACLEAQSVATEDLAELSPRQQRDVLASWGGAGCVLEAADDEALGRVVVEALPALEDDTRDQVRETRGVVLVELVRDADDDAAQADLVEATGRLLAAARSNDDGWFTDDAERWDQAALANGVQQAVALEIVAVDRGPVPGYEDFLDDQGLDDGVDARTRFLDAELADGTALWREVSEVADRIDDEVDARL
ncbi:hypothetical protein RDV89_09970 [Nocardioides zeae]|uniref:DUF305 domain-containing protein n=1 Tax=Nocardioides imazamoxiresistens TaxID=3231893 RepID=A0ABU3PVX6_9ACTN|nr:hypothetical protein [Nocardioides zeae]MDT9593394.1 hypothetical protein [Nocardioides zeae]